LGYQLDSFGCVQKYSDGTTVPDWAMNSIRDSEMVTQRFFQNFKIAAALYIGLYFIDPSENCAVAVAKWLIQYREKPTVIFYQFRDDTL